MAELLAPADAARRLGIPTQELMALVREHKIRHVMVKGVAHIPGDALEEYRGRQQ